MPSVSSELSCGHGKPAFDDISAHVVRDDRYPTAHVRTPSKSSGAPICAGDRCVIATAAASHGEDRRYSALEDTRLITRAP